MKRDMHITDASPSRVCLVLLSHLNEPISLKKLAEEVYKNAPRGRRGSPNRWKERIVDFDISNYREVQQTCNDLKKRGIVRSEKAGRESLISMDLRAFISEIFQAKKGNKPIANVVNKKKIDWEGLIASMRKERKKHPKVPLSWFGYSQLHKLQGDAKEVKAFGNTPTKSLNECEIIYLTKHINVNRLRKLCDILIQSLMLDYIGEEADVVKLFIALIQGGGDNFVDLEEGIVSDSLTLGLLGLNDIDTTPITDTVIQSFIWMSDYPEVIEFYRDYRPRY